jgi:prevent-host-death family protein
MATTRLSSRDFNQDTSRAKRAAKRGPVFITDRGRPSHVLLTVEEYHRITAGHKNGADLLAMPAAAEIEFEPPRVGGILQRSGGPDVSVHPRYQRSFRVERSEEGRSKRHEMGSILAVNDSLQSQ